MTPNSIGAPMNIGIIFARRVEVRGDRHALRARHLRLDLVSVFVQPRTARARRRHSVGQRLGGWWSTSDYTLRNFESQTVSAVSVSQAPLQPAALPTSLNVGPEFLGLIAPTSCRERVAASKARLLRFKVRCGSSPAADAAATFGRGLLILSADALEPAAPAAVGERV